MSAGEFAVLVKVLLAAKELSVKTSSFCFISVNSLLTSSTPPGPNKIVSRNGLAVFLNFSQGILFNKSTIGPMTSAAKTVNCKPNLVKSSLN